MSDGTTTTGARCEGCGEMGVMTCFECMRQEDDGIRAENARLRERVALLEGAGTHALDGLADIACVHGRAFDSNEYSDWDSYCSVCAAMRPLAAALAQAGEGGAA